MDVHNSNGSCAERALSVAVLTNQDSSKLGAIVRELFWEVVVQPEVAAPPPTSAASPLKPTPKGKTATPDQPISPKELTGQYLSSQGAGSFEVRNVESAWQARRA